MSKKYNRIPFTEKHIIDYLDECIEIWRDKKTRSLKARDEFNTLQAEAYVDAFQSVRTSLFGEIKS